MTYEETITYLYEQLPMFSRVGAAAYRKDLDNIISLCNKLENPQNEFKTVHIAGTNGKGSTSNMLAAILQQAGYKTGLFTSPHLQDFRERIRVNGQMISQDFVTSFVERIKSVSEEIRPSFFELTTAMAFDYFNQEKVDVAIIETGLGGRLDSTNIISPLLSVITNISYDHTKLLGSTLEQIAIEKAGIIKAGTPVVIGEFTEDTLPVFVGKAMEVNAVLHFSQQEFTVEYIDSTGSILLCNIRNNNTQLVEKLKLGLTGLYQTKNACTVLSTVEVLKNSGFKIEEAHIHNGLENVVQLTGFKGRWEIVESKPTVILDVAHNEAGIRSIIDQLKNNYPASAYHFVLGFVNDKELDNVLSLFPANASYYFTNAHIPRALPKEELKNMGVQKGLTGDVFEHVPDAIQQAKVNAAETDVIMVCGSFFIIAETGYGKED